MKKCVIFGAAPIEDYSFVDVSCADMIICADAGVRHAKALKIEPDLVLGDFDSCDKSETEDYVRKSFPVRKDDTDLMLAVKYALKSECDDFVIYGALGGRLDHTLASITALNFLADNNKTACLCDSKHTVKILAQGKHKIKNNGGYLSLFPYGCEKAQINLQGTAYDGDAILTASFPLGVSNEIVNDEATVTVFSDKDETRVLMVLSQKN